MDMQEAKVEMNKLCNVHSFLLVNLLGRFSPSIDEHTIGISYVL